MTSNKPKHPKHKLIRLYPILPREPRNIKTRNEEKPTQTTAAVKYTRYLFSERTQLLNGSKILWLNSTSDVTMANTSRTFQKNPGWRTLIAQGLAATYPYSRSVASVKPIQYFGTTTGSGYLSTSRGTISGTVTVNPLPNTALKDVALGRLKNRLNGYIGNAQLAAPLAEAREVHRLVRQINGLALSTVQAALAIKKTKGKSALKQFGNVWLGYGFGVNPMLSDLEKAALAVLDYQTRQDNRIRVSGTASRDYHSSIRNNPSGGAIAFGTDVWVTTSSNHVQSVRYVAGVDLKIRSAASYSVGDHLGLKVSAIPSALWELTPYSWAVDYFTTVSPWLDDVFWTLSGDTVYVSLTEKYQVEAIMMTEPVLNSPGFNWQGSFSTGRFRYSSIARTPLSSLPTRSLRVKSEDEIAKYGLTKVINLASVLAGRLGGAYTARHNKPELYRHKVNPL